MAPYFSGTNEDCLRNPIGVYWKYPMTVSSKFSKLVNQTPHSLV